MTLQGMTEHAEEVTKTIDCPRCDSEAGYRCTYVPPSVNNQHKATTEGRKQLLARVGTMTKQPHPERFAAFRKWEQKEARKKYQAVLAHQRAEKEQAVRRAWHKKNEMRIAYQEYGKREALDLASWLRHNHMIFRIDETF